MIDTHCHLYLEHFKKDVNQVICYSKYCGVQEFWLPGINSLYHLSMLNLKKQYKDLIQLIIGLHPCYVYNTTFQYELETVINFLKKNDVIAIGEIGIDLYRDSSTLEIQKIVFLEQIKLAIEKKIPIIIHSRQSLKEILLILESQNSNLLKGIVHCFSGTLSDAEAIIDLGFLIGINGLITFKNVNIDQFLHKIPIEYIVLETDSPYLAPVPFRGQRNSPFFLKYIVDKLSTIYQCSSEYIIEITTKNAKNLILK